MNELFRTLLNLPPQATRVAERIDALHFLIISASVLGWGLVVCATALFLVRWRHGATHKRSREDYRGVPAWAEVLVISGLLSMFLGFWVLGHAQYLEIETPPEQSMDVYVVGKQWMWSFAHTDGSASDYDLYVPAGRPVRLLLTSQDVIHSFFVPAFRIKQDAVPGRMTTAWFEARAPGTYPIMCAEYCGLSHSTMRGRVHVLPPAQYERWKRERALPPELVANAPLSGRAEVEPTKERANLAALGLRVAGERGCLRCHTLDGTPHLGPSWARLYNAEIPLEGGGKVRADDAYLTRSMMEPVAEVHQGFERIMPSYMGMLTPAEIGALVALIHSLENRIPDEVLAPLPVPQPVRLKEGAPDSVQPSLNAPLETSP